MNRETTTFSRFSIAAFAVISLGFQSPFLISADFTWDGGGGDGNWATADNWAGNIAPTSGNSIAFTGNTNVDTVNNLAANSTIAGIEFDDTGGAAGNFTLSGNSIELTGSIVSTTAAATRQTILLDILVNGIRDIAVNTGSTITLSGIISGSGGIKIESSLATGGTVELSGDNTYTGGTVLEEGILRLLSNNALGTGTLLMEDRGPDPDLQLGNGVTISNALTISNQGGDKRISLVNGTGMTGEYAGNITLQETGSGNFELNPNSNGGNNDTTQVLTLSGVISGTSFAPGTVAINLTGGDGTLVLSNASNSFQGDIQVSQNGGTLRIVNDAALSSANIILNNTNAHVELASGVTVDNALIVNDNNNAKRLTLESGTGLTATWAGNITVNETTNSNFEIRSNSTGGNNDQTQILTVSGDITSTAGAGVELNRDGVVRLTGNNNITGLIDLSNNGSILRLGGNNSAAGGASITMGNSNTRLQIESGVSIAANLIVENQGGNKVLEVFNGNGSVAESATYTGDINVQETSERNFDIVVADDLDTLTLTGVISGAGFAGINSQGDGTLILTGNNSFTGNADIGDGGNSTRDINGAGNMAGVVRINNNNALGVGASGNIVWRSGQLRADVPGLTLSRNSRLQGNMNLGGNNAVTLSGDIDFVGGTNRDIGHYSLDGITHTLSGNVNMREASVEIKGTNNANNGAFVFSGDISGNTTSTTDAFELDETFDNGTVTLTGNNSGFAGRFLILGSNSTLIVSNRNNLGAEDAFDAEALRIGNGGVLNTTGNITLTGNTGFRIEENGAVFDTAAGTTLSLAGNITDDGTPNGTEVLAKRGDGTMIISGNNTGTASIEIEAGTLAVSGGIAIPDANKVNLADVATAFLRLDADETFGGIAGGGSTGGGVNLQSNTLTLDLSSATSFGGDILGTGNLVMATNSRTQNLTGNTSFTGDTTINDGARLNFGTIANTHSTNAFVTSGGTIGGEGTIGNLDFASGGIIAVDGSGTLTDALSVGTLTTAANVFVDLEVLPGSNTDVITVLNFTTYAKPDAGDFALLGGSTGRASFAKMASSITFTAGFADRVWNGGNVTNPTFWDSGITNNWQAPGDMLFYNNDTVFFDDSATVGGGTGNVTVSLQSDIAAAQVTIASNTGAGTTRDYTFTDSTPGNTSTGLETLSASSGGINVGANSTANVSFQVGITGTTNVVHNGSGTLSFGQGDLSGNATAVTHTRTGSTVVWGSGTLQDQTSGAEAATKVSTLLGDTTTGSLTVGNGGTFDIFGDKNFKAYGQGSIVLGANNTTATLANSAEQAGSNEDAANAFDDEIHLAGNNILVDTEGRIDIDGAISSSVSNITLTKSNDDWLLLGGDNTGSNITQFIVNGGSLVANNNNAFNNAPITVNNGAVRGNGTRTIASDITLTGGGAGIGGASNATTTYTGTITVTANGANIDPGGTNANRRVTIAGTLAGNTTDIDVSEGVTRIASSANITYTGRFDLADSNAADIIWFELGNGVTLNNDIQVNNSAATGYNLRIVGGTATYAGDIRLLQNQDGEFNIRSRTGETVIFTGNISNDADGPGIDIVGDGNVLTTDGTVILAGNNAFTERVELQDQVTLQVGNGGTSGTLGNNANVSTVGANLSGATVAFNRSNAYTYSGVISGNTNVRQSGTGTTVLAGNNTYTGTTEINAGKISPDQANAFGTGNITFGGGALQYSGNNTGTDYSTRFKNSTGAVNLDTNGQDVTLAGAIDATNTGGLTKQGTGTLTLAGANAFTGDTTASNGTLVITGATAAGSNVFIENGATLRGGGNINGGVTVRAGGIHGAGTTAGVATQTINGAVNYEANSTVVWNLLSNSTSGGHDMFDMSGGTGALTFNTTNTDFTITFDGAVDFDNPFWATSAEWLVWDYNAAGVFDFDDANMNVLLQNNTGKAFAGTGDNFSFIDQGGAIYLKLTTPIPEPGTYGLMTLALAGFGWFARRRRITAKKDS